MNMKATGTQRRDLLKSSAKKGSSHSTKSIQALQKRRLVNAVTQQISLLFGNTLREMSKKSSLKWTEKKVIRHSGDVLEINLEIEYIGNIKDYQQSDLIASGSPGEIK